MLISNTWFGCTWFWIGVARDKTCTLSLFPFWHLLDFWKLENFTNFGLNDLFWFCQNFGLFPFGSLLDFGKLEKITNFGLNYLLWFCRSSSHSNWSSEICIWRVSRLVQAWLQRSKRIWNNLSLVHQSELHDRWTFSYWMGIVGQPFPNIFK